MRIRGQVNTRSRRRDRVGRLPLPLSVGLGPKQIRTRKLASTRIAPPRDVALHIRRPGFMKRPEKRAVRARSIPKLQDVWTFCHRSEESRFIPNFFRAQTLRPDLLEAELEAWTGFCYLKMSDTSAKECILLPYQQRTSTLIGVAMHCNLLRGLGMPSEEGDQIAVDHHESNLSESDRALLDFAVKLGTRVSEFSRKDVVKLQTLGFTEEQILECEVVTALNNFANTLQMGLGIEPDFEPPPDFEIKCIFPVVPRLLFRPGA